MIRRLVLAALALAPVSAAAADAPLSAERIAAEKCVWDAVQKRLVNGTPVADPDWDIGKTAAAACAGAIRRWAETSPAVLEKGDRVADVETMMVMHYTARGSLFAEGKAKPFHLEQPQPLTGQAAYHACYARVLDTQFKGASTRELYEGLTVEITKAVERDCAAVLPDYSFLDTEGAWLRDRVQRVAGKDSAPGQLANAFGGYRSRARLANDLPLVRPDVLAHVARLHLGREIADIRYLNENPETLETDRRIAAETFDSPVSIAVYAAVYERCIKRATGRLAQTEMPEQEVFWNARADCATLRADLLKPRKKARRMLEHDLARADETREGITTAIVRLMRTTFKPAPVPPGATLTGTN